MFDEEGNITHITTTHSVHELSVVIDDNYCIEWHVHPKLKGAVQLPSYTDLKIALKRAKGLITKNSEVVGTCNLIVSKLGLIVYRFVAKSHPNPTGFTCNNGRTTKRQTTRRSSLRQRMRSQSRRRSTVRRRSTRKTRSTQKRRGTSLDGVDLKGLEDITMRGTDTIEGIQKQIAEMKRFEPQLEQRFEPWDTIFANGRFRLCAK